MIQIQDTGIITKTRKFGESSLILDIFTLHNGVMKGMVKYATSTKQNSLYQTGNLTEAIWKARLGEHLGNFKLDLVKSYSSSIINNYLYLEGLSTVMAEISLCLPERQPFPNLYNNLLYLLDNLGKDSWIALFVLWEKNLLAELGFSMDLEKCALTGATEGLAFVSPKTARAVTEEAAGIWKDKLLPLPRFMLEKKDDCDKISADDVIKGMDLTGFFLNHYVFTGKEPAARIRFYNLLRKRIK